MCKFVLSFLLLLFIKVHSNAQKRIREFLIAAPEQKLSNSLYNSVKLVDARPDTSNMGVVQLGAFNTKAFVKPSGDFELQLNNTLQQLTDSTAASGELVILLHQLSFAEVTSHMSERGYYYFSADLYAKADTGFQKLGFVDTVVVIKSFDVTKALFSNGSKAIIDFFQQNLLKLPGGRSYSFDDLLRMDEIEKAQIKLYNVNEYSNGLYFDYHSFFSQTPDTNFTVKMKNGKISGVRTTDSTGKEIKIKGDDLYALVYEGQPYIATEYGYFPLRKDGNNFGFTGKAKVTANAGAIVAGAFFGIIGSLIAANAHSDFEMRIDHRTGGFIRIKEIPNSYMGN